ncbi:MAG: hypothetical protein LBS41_04575 [Streptococcaceae bacterium]|jgi:hypothetical protein|nr:hypothetical protein [Streptococcaceae bacterium]
MLVEVIGSWAGSAMAVIALIAFFVRPVVATFNRMSDTLAEVNISLGMLDKDLEIAESERGSLREELKKHEKRLDEHGDMIIAHDERIKTLFNERG